MIDYEETFSPVANFDPIRIILATASAKGMFLKQFDIKTAFLYGDLKENIYMKQPEGYQDGTGRVCKLQKSLYGLKQCSRCWNEKFTYILKKFNLKPTDADSCVFIKKTNQGMLILAIYIDGGLIASTSSKLTDDLLNCLQTSFELKSGEVDNFQGLQIEKLADGSIFINQGNYARKIVLKFRLDDAKNVAVPADKSILDLLIKNDKKSESTNAPYAEAIGSLMYLAIGSRPDIAFVVNSLSQHLQDPRKIHWDNVKQGSA